MKSRPFLERFGFAWQGLRHAWSGERSFRFHVVAALAVQLCLVLSRADALWWALATLTSAAVLAAELFNTALENALDRLHPEKHPSIKIAKDCAAAAVLVLSFAALGLALVYFLSRGRWRKITFPFPHNALSGELRKPDTRTRPPSPLLL